MNLLQQQWHRTAQLRPCFRRLRSSDSESFFLVRFSTTSKLRNGQAGVSECDGRGPSLEDSGDFFRRTFTSSSLLCLASFVTGPWQTSYAEQADSPSDNVGTSVLESVLSFLDSEETTQNGRRLPKGYLQNAREVVKTLKSSIVEEYKDAATFRRNADSAKEAIRNYLLNWRGAKIVAQEESYMALERALRTLGDFYSKKGPTAIMPEDVKSCVLQDLTQAEEAL